ncbi:cation:proton antiporter [Phocoenobacter skyensis]|uniref:NhaP-type Na+/H+ or K+/H+ antiporter n=1 Tax=Phocoenobacter skyensis TaxID=97481 RepID=A0A1H8A694_9PAST|nr:sodium:proton antiporter [Pasteurella skyensis]MDP8080311.1 sodium:proton antiporter [Pasteurella skyensis]MDP8086306.1 sodium:proton antiporter [Pasteurella skyensis]MDP8186118.1 sodium:proton antiporter [Pasteurella skyensis]QLB22964.1 sodium:proton antiporter [Pasteurella skyensis]SEM66006.1 NhaP-type Na+/H+ or K+/H+ antiporter [Pasteurella skyensis]
MDLALTLSAVVGLGIGAQWLAWYLKQPSILFLLLIGILVGPVLNIFSPDAVLGELLFPFISLGVAIILFEGALTLEFEEIQHHGKVVKLLVSVGMLVTTAVISLATYWLFDVDWRIALLFGALVCVTGPTVIVPLLRSVRPNRTISNILKWEGILIDPIGAIAVVLVYEYIISAGTSNEIWIFVKIVIIATILGMLGALCLAKLIKHHLIPDYLRNVFVLAYVLLLFSISNALSHESGLLTVTVLGVALANWKNFPKDNILEFKESLTVLLISVLFIVLAARIDLDALLSVGFSGILLLLIAMFVARPLAIWASSIGSKLTLNEKLMISWVGPRGIVAAAISSLFAIRLQDLNIQGVELLVPLVFTIIIGTVFIQGLGAKAVATFLKVREVADTGVLIVGANPVALMIAKSLKDLDFKVIMTHTNYNDLTEARMMGIQTYYGSPLSNHADSHLDLIGIGYLFTVSTDQEMNILSAAHYLHEFGEQNIFRLEFNDKTNLKERHQKQNGFTVKCLFGEDVTYGKLSKMLNNNAKIKVTNLTESYNYTNYKVDNNNFIPLYTVDKNGLLNIIVNSQEIPNDCKLISLVLPNNLDLY